jgi:tetratricopeptide (TPR) repeat protein
MTGEGLRFDDEDALVIALCAGWVPAGVAGAPAHVVRDGGLVITPSVAVPSEARARLESRGVTSNRASGGDEVSCWAEAIRPRRAVEAGLGAGTVVFLLPDAKGVVSLAAELLRLGCDRQEARIFGDRALLRAVAPPFHTVARALDRAAGLRAYRAVGDGRVLVELGWEHPMATRLSPSAGTVLLIGDARWQVVADGDFDDLLPHVELVLARSPTTLEPRRELPRIPVPLSLARSARRADASLWVVSRDAVGQVERFVRSTPDEVVSKYLFAIADEPTPRVFLRRKAASRGVDEPSLDAEAFAAHPQIANLFVPADASLEPPLRHGRLRELLAPDPALAVLVSRGARSIERIPDDAFRPLDAFVDYLVDREARVLATWVESATFDFLEYAVDDAPPAEREERRHTTKRDGSVGAATAPAPAAPRRKRREASPAAPAPPVPLTLAPSAAAEALTRAERAFLDSEAPLDDPARVAMWIEMGDLAESLGRERDAAHAFARALWATSGDEARAIAERWARASPDVTLASLGKTAAPPDEVRRTLAHVLARPDDAPLDASALARFLDAHDASLDVRTMWLARVRAARSAGDALLLARARDRALARLARGLSIERDVPTFLRFLGRGSPATEHLSRELSGLVSRVAHAQRARSPVEAKPHLTSAYVELTIAHGLARLGASDAARSIAREATARLDLADPVHRFLARAYGARLEQALAGEPAESPLPAAVAGELNGLEKFLRYKVDRLRQSSAILEPVERLDPIAAFQRGETDPRGDAFAPLRAMQDVEALATALEAIVRGALGEGPERRARTFDAALDLAPQLSEARAVTIAEVVLANVADVPPLARAQLFEEVLRVAGHFGDARLSRAAFTELVPLVRSFDTGHVGELSQVLSGTVRALRRVGLRDEAIALLESCAALARGDALPNVVAAVQVAGGLAAIGREDEARPTFERALTRLATEMSVPDRLVLTRAVARGVATCEQSFALGVLRRLETQLPKISDSFNTNSHFCLSVVAFVEALVVGYASDDLALGDAARRFFDEDEHLVRRRIHREARR